MARVSVTENALKILNFLKENNDNYTAEDLANELGLPKKTVDGVVTSGLQKKGYAKRVPAEIEIEGEEGPIHKAVKFIKLTDEGKAYDHEAATKADVEAALAGK